MKTPVDNPVEVALEAIDRVLNTHENQLWPADLQALLDAKSQLKIMLMDGFK